MKFLFKPLLFFVLLCLSFQSFSQKYEDSLKTQLKFATDTNKINLLNKLSFYFCERNDSLSVSYANEAINLSEKLNFLKGKANALNNKGIVCDVMGNYDSALFYYNTALDMAFEIKDDGLKANVYNNIGLIYWNKGEYDKALNVYYISLKINENAGDKKGIAKVMSNLGLIYYDLKKYKQALYYHFQALKIREELKDNYGIGVSLTNIGLIYDDLDSLDLAIQYFKKSISFKKQADDLYGLAIVYNDIGISYNRQGKPDEALAYYFLALPLREASNDEFGLITTYNNIAEIYRGKKAFATSLAYSSKALALAENLGSKSKLKMVYLQMYLNYKDMGNFREALNYFEKYDFIKDSIYTLESAESMNEMQTRYETEKKEQQLKLKSAEIEKQKYRYNIQTLTFMGLALLIIVIFIFVYYRNKQKQKAEQIKENNRQDKLRFKAVIESEENERIRIAKDLHDGLGQILSSAKLNLSSLEDSVLKEDEYLLQNAMTIIDEAVNEVRTISHNMMPTALINYDVVKAVSVLVGKINDTGHIKVNFDHAQYHVTLKKEVEITLYRVIQEILNNMIKHSQTQNINIILEGQKESVTLSIKDYGTGFNTSQIAQSKGIGWQNIYSRVGMLNGNIVVDSQIGKGTNITLTFNI